MVRGQTGGGETGTHHPSYLDSEQGSSAVANCTSTSFFFSFLAGRDIINERVIIDSLARPCSDDDLNFFSLLEVADAPMIRTRHTHAHSHAALLELGCAADGACGLDLHE